MKSLQAAAAAGTAGWGARHSQRLPSSLPPTPFPSLQSSPSSCHSGGLLSGPGLDPAPQRPSLLASIIFSNRLTSAYKNELCLVFSDLNICDSFSTDFCGVFQVYCCLIFKQGGYYSSFPASQFF